MTALLRVLPAFDFGSRRSLRLIERNLYVYKHGWMVLLSGFFEPLFYLLGIGFGLGALIGTIPGPDGQPISYQLFVAPALLASAAMNGAINESTFNFFFKLNYNKTFTSILSTPLSPSDIALGELGWALIRGGLYAVGFMGVMVVFGLFVSPWVILAVPAALLVGFAFGAVGMAATSFMKTWQDFDLIQLVVLPMFLFSGTFYPIDGYPPLLQAFVRITPLYQGVDLIRSLTVGAISPVLLVHVAYLSIMGIVGLAITSTPDRQAPAQVGRWVGGWRDRSGGPRRADRGDRGLPPLPAARRVARAGRAREGRPVPRRDVLGPAAAGLRRSATPGSCCSGSRRPPTAGTGPGGSSPVTPRATSCGPRSTRSASPTGRPRAAPTTA